MTLSQYFEAQIEEPKSPGFVQDNYATCPRRVGIKQTNVLINYGQGCLSLGT